MPDIEWNLRRWGGTHDWSRNGDEWSDKLGGPEGQWFWWLYPRIHRFLPAGRILEIAPGFGRWTQFLLDHTDDLVAVDLAPLCIEGLERRFAGHKNLHAYVNDGRTLPMVEDDTVDFVFSFGSMIHIEFEVVQSYLREFARVLRPDGLIFIQHSNAGSPGFIGKELHNHSKSVSSENVAETAREVGLTPIFQELFSWLTNVDELLGCMSVLVGPKHELASQTLRTFVNPYRDAAAAYVDTMARTWSLEK